MLFRSYTKEKKSKSFFCAGYYAVKYKEWGVHFCPKAIIVYNYDFEGPFKTTEEAEAAVERRK